MLHTEHFLKADRSYEIRHDGNGNAIHVLIKDGYSIIFPSLTAMIENVLYGEESERFYLEEECLDKLYNRETYDYYELKEIAKTL